MRLFYRIPPDLGDAWDLLKLVGSMMADPYTTPSTLEEVTAHVESVLAETRLRLLAEGRDRDLNAFVKHATKEGIYLVHRNNRVYNEAFLPLVRTSLDPAG